MAEVTKQFRKRNAILAYLQNTTVHPSAEMVFAGLKPQIPDLSLGTVYRNLKLFCNQGFASCVATVGGVERFDGNTNPHVHFICNQCDAVIDLMEMEIPSTLTGTAESCSGGQVTDCQLSFTGQCKACLANNQKGGETI